MSFDEQAAPVLALAEQQAAEVDREVGSPRTPWGRSVGRSARAHLADDRRPDSAGRRPTSSASQAIASRCASTAMIYLMHVCAAQVAHAGAPATTRSVRWPTGRTCDPRLQRAGLAQPLLGAIEQAGGLAPVRAEVVRDVGRSRRELRGRDTVGGRRDADRVEPRPGLRRGIEVSGAWLGLGLGATPAPR